MYSYTFASLLATICLLEAPLCECFFLESLFQEIPGLDGTTSFENSPLSKLNPILSDLTTKSSGDLKKDVPIASSEGISFGDIPCELDSLGNETSLSVTIEKPINGFPVSKANKQSNQSLKLSDLFSLKSIFDNLQNGNQVAHKLKGVDSNNKYVNYVLTDNELNGEPNGNGISIIVVENQPTTQKTTTTTTTAPTVTTEAGVITIKNNLQNCLNKNDCDLFNIQGLLWKLFNPKPAPAETTQQPTTTPQPQVDNNRSPFFLNFNDIFFDTAPTTAAPVVETTTAVPAVAETTEAITNKDIFGDCGNGNSQRNCGPNIFNLQDLIYKILNIKPSNNAHQKTTQVPKSTSLENQRTPGQNVPSQVFREVFPMLDFQKFLPNVAKIFLPVQENPKQPEQNELARNSKIVESVQTVPGLSNKPEQKYNGQKQNENKLNALSGNFFDGVKSFLENLNLLK